MFDIEIIIVLTGSKNKFRLSMTALRSTARQVLCGLAIVGPACVHQRIAREAARRAHLDAFGTDRGAPWRDPTNGG